LRVVELAALGPVPFAGMLLADLGADVVRIDRLDQTGVLAVPEPDLLGRGKRSVGCNLKNPDDVATVRALAARADVVVEGFRPGVAERLEIGPAQLLAANPRLVYGRMTGWGQHGPLAQTAGHDLTYLAMTGVLHAMGPADGPPIMPLNLVGDFGGGGMLLAVGVLSGLYALARTGHAQLIDASIMDGTALLATSMFGMLHSGAWRDERGANLLDGGAPFYAVYPTADHRYLAVGALESRFYVAFLAGLGEVAQDWPQYDRSRWPALRARIAQRIATRTRDEWTEIFIGSDACVAPVLSLTEAAGAGHPQLGARGTFVTVNGVRQPAVAPRVTSALSAPVPASSGPRFPGRPPQIGEHNAEVLDDWDIPPNDGRSTP
jgi:alpha-methylacyl-CoA racemase